MISTKKSPPAYSMGKVTRGKHQLLNNNKDSKLKSQETALGPGSYELHFKGKEIGPKYTMGMIYPSLQKFQTPGAGEYIIPSKIVESQGKSMGRKSNILFSSMIPGPGSYDSNLIKKRNYRYSMGQRVQDDLKVKDAERSSKLPGPSNYEQKLDHLSSSPKQKFSISVRRSVEDFEKKSRVPGPGSYSVTAQTLNKVKESSPKYRFGTSEREKLTKSDLPGPGSYKYKEVMGKDSPLTAIIGNSDSATYLKQSRNQPGPGSYDPTSQMSRFKALSYKFGEKLFDFVQENKNKRSVGPAEYSPKKQAKFQSQSWKFAQSKRPNQVSKEFGQLPAPGQYDLQSKIGNEGKKIIMHKRLASADFHKGKPGPNAYYGDSKLVTMKSPSYRMGEKRQNSGGSRKNSLGPGSYENLIKKIQPTANIGTKDKRFTDIKVTVGAGHYNIDGIIGKEGFQTSMGVRREQLMHDKQIPGPGAYQHRSALSQLPSFAMSKSPQRPPGYLTKQPHAQTYTVNDHLTSKMSPGYKLGKDRRRPAFDEKTARLFPGPGYHDPNLVKASPRAFGQGKSNRFENYGKNQSPGPGAYKVPTTIANLPSHKSTSIHDLNYKFV